MSNVYAREKRLCYLITDTGLTDMSTGDPETKRSGIYLMITGSKNHSDSPDTLKVLSLNQPVVKGDTIEYDSENYLVQSVKKQRIPGDGTYYSCELEKQ